MSSFLPEVDIAQAMKDHDTESEETAAKRFTRANGKAHAAVQSVMRGVAANHTDQVKATNAASDFLEQLADHLNDNGVNIANSINSGSTNQAELQQARQQVQQLESNQTDLENAARNASNLQGQVSELERNLKEAQAEANELRNQLNTKNKELSDAKQAQQKAENDLKQERDKNHPGSLAAQLKEAKAAQSQNSSTDNSQPQSAQPSPQQADSDAQPKSDNRTFVQKARDAAKGVGR